MRFIVYRVNKKNKEKKFSLNPGIEKILIVSFIIVFSLMIFVQALLATSSTRTFLVEDVEFEGNPLKTEEYLYKQGDITLELLNGDCDENLKILVNGDEVACFLAKTVELTVKEGDVLEIDGTGSELASQVAVKSCSDNMEKSCIGKTINVLSDIKNLLKIKMK